MTRALALAAVALSACGDNVDPAPPHGGTRLRLVDFVFDDGTRTTDKDNFFDEVLQDRCRATEFSDGARYCMPDSAWGDTVFVDEHCGQALGFALGDEPVPKYFVGHHTLHGTPLPSRLYRAGPAVDAPALVWRLEDNLCIGPDLPQIGNYYATGDKLTTDDLVRIRERARISGTRLEAAVDTSDDGLAVFGTLYDQAAGACDLVAYPNADAAMCVPHDQTALWYFADTACTQLLVAQPASKPLEQAFRFDPTSDCGMLFDVGDRVSISDAYELMDGKCVYGAVPSGYELHATSPATRDVATLSRAILPSSRRLSLLELVDGTLRVPGRRLLDRDLDAECDLATIGDELRCLPLASAELHTVFADPSCTTTIDIAYVHEGACDPTPRFAAHLEVRKKIDAPYTAAFYELDTGDTCSVLDTPPGFSAYAVGPALSSDELAGAIVEIQR